MVTETAWNSWQTDDFRYYLDTVLDCFGPDRLMTGSDWPVCTVAGSYQNILEIVTNYVVKFNNNIRQKILGTNCLEFYTNR